MTSEPLDSASRKTIAKAATKKEKSLVRVRTEWRTGSGTFFSPWRVLKDDPRNGIYDLTNWNRKFHAFDGRHVSRKRYPSRYRAEGYECHAEEPDSSSSSSFPSLTEAQEKELAKLFESQHGLYLNWIGNKIREGELREDLKLEALDAIFDGIRAAYLKYDPEHPPKYRLKNGDKPKPASRETFCARVARNSLADFVDFMNASKRRVWVTHLSISEKDDGPGEVSAECLADDHRPTIRDVEFRIDVETLRNHLPSHLRDVLDMLLEEWPRSLICRHLSVSPEKFNKQFLSPIQNLAADLGFEPSSDDMLHDRMYVFRRKLRRFRRENKHNTNTITWG